jgi:hypothetical protein
MKQYTISYIHGEADWSSIPVLPIDHLLWSPEVPIKAEAQLAYDDQRILVHLLAKEPNIRAEETGPLGEPYLDSCLEFFFAPVEGDSRYINIEVNPNGCLWMGIGLAMADRLRIVPVNAPFIPAIQKFDGGWEVFYRIPYSFIRTFFPNFQAVSGGKIQANLYKCGDLTVQEHYLSAFPIDLPNPNFHCSDFFQDLYFA